jgi:hypothetical protein
MKTETPRVNELLGKLLSERGEVCERNAPEAWVKLARQLERELNEAKELMATAANWVEACPFDNSIIFAEKLRAAAQPNIRS